MKISVAGFLILATVIVCGIAYADDFQASKNDNETLYNVNNLDSLGGTSSSGISINNRGWVTGLSNLSEDVIVHATLWQNELPIDLGALGDPDTNNSGVIFPVKNKRGVIVGISQTDTIDPRGEQWSCSAFIPFTGHTCVGFVWKDGVMDALPTLGGPNGFAAGVNKQGQIVGWAENTIEDPTCDLTRTQRLNFLPVIWGPEEDQIQELPLFPGDTAGAAVGNNDKGQVVGISGTCDRAVGGFTAAHALLWENGSITDMGNIGGNAWNTPVAINKYGVAVGFANVTLGRPFNAHAFRWSLNEGIQDLGVLPAHSLSEGSISQALGINKHGQVVGISCLAGFVDCRAFIWENGVMTDLNTLVGNDYSDHLVFANDINDAGEITGGAFNSSTLESLAFLAVPIHGHNADETEATSSAQSSTRKRQQVILPEKVKLMLLKKLGFAGLGWLE
jgi:probable HAF family extracellular repeat protein